MMKHFALIFAVFISLLIPSFAIAQNDDLSCNTTTEALEEGIAHWKEANAPAAIELLTCVIQLDPANYEAYAYRGTAYRSIYKSLEAIDDFEKLIELDPEDPLGFYLLASAYFRQGDYEIAVENYTHGLSLQPKVSEHDDFNITAADYYVFRGRAYTYLEMYDEALNDLEHALELSPNDALAFAARGFVHLYSGNAPQAVQDWFTARTLASDVVDVYLTEGKYLVNAENFDQAIVLISESILLDPDDFRGYVARGVLYQSMEDFEAAVDDVSRAIELNPESAILYNLRGQLHNQLKEYELGLEDLNTAIELDPDLMDAYNNRGVSYYNTGQRELAWEDWNYYAENGGLVEAYIEQGNLSFQLGEYDVAATNYWAALLFEPENHAAHLGLANIYFERGLYKLALESYKTYTELVDGEIDEWIIERIDQLEMVVTTESS